MSIVVTGATGQLGRLIVESLITGGVPTQQIVAGGRNTQKIADLADRGVRVVSLDYDDVSSIDAALDSAQTLMLVSSSDPGKRIPQHAAAIDAAKRAGVKRIVYTSAPRADDTALILAPDHKATEELILASGIPYTILRNGWYTENYLDAARQGIASGQIVASVGDGRVASASRKDYADAAAAVILGPDHENKIYELSGDVAWNFEELAATVARISGKPVEYAPVTSEGHIEVLKGFGLDEGTAHFVVALDGNIRDGLLAETSGDLGRIIGRPTTPLKDGLAAAL